MSLHGRNVNVNIDKTKLSFYAGAPLTDIKTVYLKVPLSWRRWRDTIEEGKFRPIVLTPVVSSQSWRYFVSLARRTRQGAVTFGQSIDSTRGCAVVFEMKRGE